MKRLMIASFACAVLALPALGQSALVLKKHIEIDDKAKDEKIKAQEKVVRYSEKKEDRLTLADLLESSADDCARAEDLAGAWRYYQRAAAVLRDPREESWETRAAEDTTKAASFREKETEQRYRIEEARAIRRRAAMVPAIEAPSINWQEQKEQDNFAENRYREEVWKLVQTAWRESEARKAVTDTSNFKKPAIISFDVHSEGNVTDIKIVSSSGDPQIDLAAFKVVQSLGKMQPLVRGMGSLVRFQTEFGK